MNNQQQQIAEYLSNEAKLYQDWYKAVTQMEDDDAYTIPRAKLPSLESLKEQFMNWFNDNCTFFKEKICPKWLYLQKIEGFHNKQHVIAAIVTDVVLTPLIHPNHTAVIVTLLVINGCLDKLCDVCVKE